MMTTILRDLAVGHYLIVPSPAWHHPADSVRLLRRQWGRGEYCDSKRVDFLKSTEDWQAIFSKALREGGGGAITVLQEM